MRTTRLPTVCVVAATRCQWWGGWVATPPWSMSREGSGYPPPRPGHTQPPRSGRNLGPEIPTPSRLDRAPMNRMTERNVIRE